MAFDGETTYISIPSFQFNGQPPWTIEAVVCPAQMESKGHGGIVVGDVQFGGTALLFEESRWQFIMRFGGKYQRAKSDREPSIGKIVHLAGVWDGREARLYVDGKVQSSRAETQGQPQLSQHPFMVGADPGARGQAEGFFKGTIYQVHVSTVALYQEDFTPSYQLEKTEGTVLFYDLTNARGNTVQDQSGMDHHGRVFGVE